MTATASRPAPEAGARTAPDPGPRRNGVSPWVLLTVTDLIAISTLARCFSGPGELAVLLPACLAGHLLAGGGRRAALALAHRPGDPATWSRGRPTLVLAAAGWLLALAATFMLPLAALDAHFFHYGLPLTRTWHVVGGQLSTAWSIFSNKIAPVLEAPGLVLAAGWAAGAVGLASEVLYADAGLPAILALVPAFDVVVFTGTLGTSSGRAVELAAVAGVSIAFLVSAQSDRKGDRRVVRARAEVRSAPGLAVAPAGDPWPPAGDGHAVVQKASAARRPHPRVRRVALPSAALVAAVAAGVIGPAIPGATSAPLISWHGSVHRTGGKGNGSGAGGTGPGRANTTDVSNFVQVAEQEVENSDALLFTVHSSLRLRETLLTLDRFNGNSWSRVSESSGSVSAVPQFTSSLSSAARRPPPPLQLPEGLESVEQVIDISSLGGRWLPTPGVTTGVNGISGVSRIGASGPISSLVGLTANLRYGVRAIVTASPAGALSQIPAQAEKAGPPADLQLPGPVPSSLVGLAHEIAGGATDPYDIAERLQDYFLFGHGFVYHLPSLTPSGAIADASQSYVALESFLFGTRTGYCQQYATAFAVLARILGLPTRIVVGFLPGKEIAKDEYVVTGASVHAWPEVDFPGIGWVTFEPTPGAAPPIGQHSQPPTSLPHGGGPVASTIPHAIGPNFAKVRGDRAPSVASPHHLASAAPKAARDKGSSGVVYLLLALAILALAWLLGVPAWRLLRRRSERRDLRRATAAAWRAALSALAAAGAHRRRSETHLEFVDRVRRLGVISGDATRALERLAERMDRALYAAPSGADTMRAEAAAAWAESRIVVRAARRRISAWQRISVLLDPRDLLGAA